MSHVPVMERLSILGATASADRDLLDAIRAWQGEPHGMGFLEFTGLRPAELGAICRDETPVAELLERRAAQPLAA